MKKIRPSAVAGMFYPESKSELLSFMDNFKQKARKHYDISTRAVIVPHAGYVYSGQLAYEGLQYLNPSSKNIFIIAPAHYVGIKGIAVSSFDAWKTPLGEVDVNQEINELLVRDFGAKINDEAIAPEHSLEVQVPFVQKLFPTARIVPILVGETSPEQLTEIISYFWTDDNNSFVISSDLSHFHQDNEAQKIDTITAEMIENKDLSGFNPHQACGYVGVLGIVGFAQKKEASLIRVNLQNSAVVSGDKSRVVGYGSWILYEGEKEKFVKDNFSEFLLDICKKSIASGLKTGRPLSVDTLDIPEVLHQSGASFVTLEIAGSLRGCIGSIIAQRPLIEDIAQNAYNSGFSDSRFRPLRQEEFGLLDIAVSLLTAPSQMSFEDEEDLLRQIEQDLDGIIIKDGAYMAVYLPSVWEQIPDKKLFLTSLKQKAGMSPHHFSKTFEAYRFRSEYIKSKPD